jgi:hypothetical protein
MPLAGFELATRGLEDTGRRWRFAGGKQAQTAARASVGASGRASPLEPPLPPEGMTQGRAINSVCVSKTSAVVWPPGGLWAWQAVETFERVERRAAS